MNNVKKYVGLLAIIPLFTIALTIGYIDDAEARQKHACGVNELCFGPAPNVEAKAVEQLSPYLIVDDVKSPVGYNLHEYMVVIKAYAGDNDVVNLQLLVKSDVDAVTVTAAKTGGGAKAGFIGSGAHSIVPIKIQAADPSSIRAEILSSQSSSGIISEVEAKAVETSPFLAFKGAKVFVGGEPNEYLATFNVFAGDKDVRNLQLLVKSDVDAEKIMVHGSGRSSGGSSDTSIIWANTYYPATVKIFALDAGSIDGEILSWELD